MITAFAGVARIPGLMVQPRAPDTPRAEVGEALRVGCWGAPEPAQDAGAGRVTGLAGRTVEPVGLRCRLTGMFVNANSIPGWYGSAPTDSSPAVKQSSSDVS